MMGCFASRTRFISVFRDDDPLRERANTFYEYAKSVLTKGINAWRTTSIDSERMQEKDQDGMF